MLEDFDKENNIHARFWRHGEEVEGLVQAGKAGRVTSNVAFGA
jgi:hypothetical protein